MPPPNRLMAPPALQAYQPTLRDRVANRLLSLLGDGYEQQRFVENLLGSIGLGRTKTGTADFIPVVGQALQADEAGRQIAAGHPYAGGANLLMAALPVPAAAKGVKAVANKLLPETVQAAERAVPQIVAYHGSPHTFDAFDASKIGTGEGAQAYGHGLYFAQNEATAKAYRDVLAPLKTNVFDIRDQIGSPLALTPKQAADVFHHALSDAPLDRAARSVQAAHPELRGDGESFVGPLGPMGQQIADLVSAVRDRGQGSMYQVGINAHPDHFLDWDKPLTEQHPAVLQALDPLIERKALANRFGYTTNDLAKMPPERLSGLRQMAGDLSGDKAAVLSGKGADLYSGLTTEANSRPYQPYSKDTGQSRATDALSELGIPGIKYLDAGSRSAGDGTRNFVVFDPKNIDILKRYGIAATALGAGGVGAAMSQQSDTPTPTL
jgi:hypothetical protein